MMVMMIHRRKDTIRCVNTSRFIFAYASIRVWAKCSRQQRQRPATTTTAIRGIRLGFLCSLPIASIAFALRQVQVFHIALPPPLPQGSIVWTVHTNKAVHHHHHHRNSRLLLPLLLLLLLLVLGRCFLPMPCAWHCESLHPPTHPLKGDQLYRGK